MQVLHQENFSEPKPYFSSGYKITASQKELLWELSQEKPETPSDALLREVERIEGRIPVTIRHLNRLRLSWQLNRKQGRPLQGSGDLLLKEPGEVVQLEGNLLCVGVHFFEDWMEAEGRLRPVVELLSDSIGLYIGMHPEMSFALLIHRESTLFDVKEHPLATLIGQSYQSSTLNQFLGQLERIDAGEFLMKALFGEGEGRELCYIDGHLVAFWSRQSMHKGKITMLGRIMPGSQAVVAHDEKAQALFAQYYPPDIPLSALILEYCHQMLLLTGIDLFVIDRAVNSLAIATAFKQRDWGLLSMLDKNEYQELSDWNTEFEGQLEDGSQVHSGQWSEKEKREKDPRWFVIVEREGKLLPYWATSKFKEHFDFLQWPLIYSRRTEIQENNFKRMIEHGALNVNYGIKKIIGEDRHQQRKIKELAQQRAKKDQKLEKKEEALLQQQIKVEQSEQKGHRKRLQQRQTGLKTLREEQKQLQNQQEEIQKQIDTLGPPKQRADRDFRKQTIMLFRTLFLENSLRAFWGALLEKISVSLSLEMLLSLLFNRGGASVETKSEKIYFVNTNGLSLQYQRVLQEVVEGMNAMRLKHQGKSVRVKVRGSPLQNSPLKRGSPDFDSMGTNMTQN